MSIDHSLCSECFSRCLDTQEEKAAIIFITCLRRFEAWPHCRKLPRLLISPFTKLCDSSIHLFLISQFKTEIFQNSFRLKIDFSV